MKKLDRGQQGFTLIELVVVIAIIGVLAAIAVPMVSNFLGSAKEQSWKSDRALIQTAVGAHFAAPGNVRFLGKPQYPLIGSGQTNQALTNQTASTTLRDDGDPFTNATSDELWNPVGGSQGADLSTVWTDVNGDGVRTKSGTSLDTWGSVPVTRGNVNYQTDPRYFFINFEQLASEALLDGIPESAAPDNAPEGSTQAHTGSYIWYVDDTGKVQALFRDLPSAKGFQDGVFP